MKYIEGKFMKSDTTFFTQQQNDGSILEMRDKTPLEDFII